ncbi:MAG: hypothetical protein JSR85_04670 [Proteobacteria bacterium]|nr:hypothetical protein [Pseudomonadota bacterium]
MACARVVAGSTGAIKLVVCGVIRTVNTAVLVRTLWTILPGSAPYSAGWLVFTLTSNRVILITLNTILWAGCPRALISAPKGAILTLAYNQKAEDEEALYCST